MLIRNQERIQSALRELRRVANVPEFVPNFRLRLIRESLDNFSEHVRCLFDPISAFDLNLLLSDKAFREIGFAFGQACQVRAVSVDKPLGFWRLQNLQRITEYIRFQPRNTKRLFVFTNENNLLEHRNILAAHYQQYGEAPGGAVLFCSWSRWIEWMRNNLDESLQKDFCCEDTAVLKFDNGGNAEFYKTLLSGSNIRFSAAPGLELIFAKLQEQFTAVSDDLMEDDGLYRWKSDFSVNNDVWHRVVDKAFSKDTNRQNLPRGCRIYHMVFFAAEAIGNDPQSFLQELIDGVKGIRGCDGRVLCQDIWVGQHGTGDPELLHDGRFWGRIFRDNLLARMFPFCAVMKFGSHEDLRIFYESEEHSKIRERLFRRFGDYFERHYDAINDPETSDELKRLLYEGVEARASKCFFRLDYYQPGQFNDFGNVDPIQRNVVESLKKQTNCGT